jgi:4-amino-4-deoxy-L-arabinose transferase-like glycosyltransferase
LNKIITTPRLFLLSAGLLVCLLCFYPLFTRLGTDSIYMWDEALYANNAIDMYLSHDFIVVRDHGHPDLYNTKPPFVLWMQVISIHIFGMNEFAIRFPSALFAALTMLLLLWFSITVLNSYLIGFIAMLTLACSNGFISNHGARSGDLDSCLVFWMTLATLIYLRLLITNTAISKNLLIMAIALTCTFLCKGIAGFFFVPFFIIITIVNGNFLSIIRRKEIYISATAVLIICAGYYFIREQKAAGYLDVILNSELKRYEKPVMSWHVQPSAFYLGNLIYDRFTPFIWLLPLSVLALFILKDVVLRKTLLFLCILSSGYLLLISFPADKLNWYDEPLFPLLSLMIAISISGLADMILSLPAIKNKRVLYWFFIFMLCAFYYVPYKNIVIKSLSSEQFSQIDPMRIPGAYMKYLHEHFPEQKEYSIYKSPPYDPEHEDQLEFYRRVYQQCNNNKILVKHSASDLIPGEYLLICEADKLDSVQKNFNFTLIDKWNSCEYLLLKNRISE